MTSVREEWDIGCPQCGKDSQIDIDATVCVRLTPDGTDADESLGGDHEWGDESNCYCRACGHRGTVAEFRRENYWPRHVFKIEEPKFYISTMGKSFLVRGIFTLDDHANKYMEEEDGMGVIATCGPFIFVADEKETP